MTFEPADYAVLSITVITAVFGLFIGFSGALAFFLGSLAASAFGYFAWDPAADLIASFWLRSIAVGVVTLLIFGVVRFVVKKCVHGLVAQPGDALFGAVVSAISGASVSLAIIAVMYYGMNWDAVRSLLLEKVLILIGR